MKITEKQKQALLKYAKFVECDWFDFAVDDEGNDCVLDKESNIKLNLIQGIDELKFYDMDAMELLLYGVLPVKIIEENSTLYYYYTGIDKKTKLRAGMVRILKKYPLDVAQTLLTEEEKWACSDVFDLAYRSRTVNRYKAIGFLQKIIKYIEKNQGSSIMENGLDKEFDITPEEYDYIFNNPYYR